MRLNGITRFLRDRSGATAIEYGLIAALIAAVLVASVGLMGNNLTNLYAGGTGSAAAAMDKAINP